ncbi:bifunctional Protein phosphatase methylesterase [Babesia duncani]|uniref:protein phosphatase methylesterase-1 n=1 Tax=Babesia duncani TaxID=323732 RepID=A0AAD9PNG2_9APIC|nr:bifunctional Protein phosphatase methylesterase [Babesia duncani]
METACDVSDWRHYFKRCSRISVEMLKDVDEYSVYQTYTVDDIPCYDTDPVLVICVHGYGLSAMSWATTARQLTETAMVAAVDLRGHGETYIPAHGNKYLCSEVIVMDVICVMRRLLDEINEQINRYPRVILVGHSLGAAIAIKVVDQINLSCIIGMIAIDFSEENVSANYFKNTLNAVNQIPESFNTIDDAIEWMVKTQRISTAEAARISVPSQLIQDSGVWRWKCHPKDTSRFWIDAHTMGLKLVRGHMQGKFQLILLKGFTHLIHVCRRKFYNFSGRYPNESVGNYHKVNKTGHIDENHTRES